MQQIILDGVTRNYNGKVVLRPINHIFEKGQSVAFVGHNGCGKSTLIKIIAGLVAPTNGRVQYKEALRFSYVPEKFMPLRITARRYLRRVGEIEGMKGAKLEEKINSLGSDFFMDAMLDISMQSMSKGTLQKVGVIQAIMSRPDVILLDEPLSGQDVDSQQVFISKINELREAGVTVFMACHEPKLVDALSEQTYTIEGGELKQYEKSIQVSYTVLFENTSERAVPKELKRYGNGYRVTLMESEVQEYIRHMMNEGWTLKGMIGNDNETA